MKICDWKFDQQAYFHCVPTALPRHGLPLWPPVFVRASILASPWGTNCPNIPVQRAFDWDQDAMHEARTHGAPEFLLKIWELDEALHLALHGIHSCYQWHHMCIRVHSTLASRSKNPSAHAKSTHLRMPRTTHLRTPQAYIRTHQANDGLGLGWGAARWAGWAGWAGWVE